MYGIDAGQRKRNQRVAHLVIGDDLALLWIEKPVSPLLPGDHALDGIIEVGHRDCASAATCREQCGFIDQVGEVGSGEARRERRNRLDIDAWIELHFFHMHLENFNAALLVGAVDQHLPIEAAGTQQRRIEDFRPIGGGEDDEAGAGVEAVEFDQQLIERLFFLVVAACKRPNAAGAAQRIEFVDEDDGRRLLVSLLKQVAHPRRADADEHLDELRT